MDTFRDTFRKTSKTPLPDPLPDPTQGGRFGTPSGHLSRDPIPGGGLTPLSPRPWGIAPNPGFRVYPKLALISWSIFDHFRCHFSGSEASPKPCPAAPPPTYIYTTGFTLSRTLVFGVLDPPEGLSQAYPRDRPYPPIPHPYPGYTPSQTYPRDRPIPLSPIPYTPGYGYTPSREGVYPPIPHTPKSDIIMVKNRPRN